MLRLAIVLFAVIHCDPTPVDPVATLVGATPDITRSATTTTTQAIPNDVDFLEAYNHYVEAVAKWGHARADYERAMGEKAQAIAAANIDQAKAAALQAALLQARKDFHKINQVIDAQYARVATLYRYHKQASQARDGNITPQRARALRRFFIHGAIGKTRRELLGQALKDLRASEPHTFGAIINEDGRIVELAAENFVATERRVTTETYLIPIPKDPPRGGVWELHLTTPLDGSFRKRIEIRTTDDAGIPDPNELRHGYVYRRWQAEDGRYGKTYTKKESLKLVLQPHLQTDNHLWVRLTGGRADFQTGEEQWFLPAFTYVPRDTSGRGRTTSVGAIPVPSDRVVWLEDGVRGPKPFEPSTPSSVAGLVTFSARQELTLDPEQPALDILDASIAAVENNARDQILATVKETLAFREGFAKLELELIKALGEATQK